MKKLFCTILIVLGSILMLAMNNPNLQDNLDTLSQMVRNLTRENLQLKQTVSELRLREAEFKIEKLNDKIALYPMVYYREQGYFKADNPYARDPEHFKRVWLYCNKYKYLLSKDALEICKKQDIDPVKFNFVWHHKESKYSPLIVCTNKNGTRDYGMAQINDCVWDTLYAQLPENLKKIRNPKLNPEIAVAMLYLWMSDRTKQGMSWCYLNNEAWTMYWFIGEIQRNG